MSRKQHFSYVLQQTEQTLLQLLTSIYHDTKDISEVKSPAFTVKYHLYAFRFFFKTCWTDPHWCRSRWLLSVEEATRTEVKCLKVLTQSSSRQQEYNVLENAHCRKMKQLQQQPNVTLRAAPGEFIPLTASSLGRGGWRRGLAAQKWLQSRSHRLTAVLYLCSMLKISHFKPLSSSRFFKSYLKVWIWLVL